MGNKYTSETRAEAKQLWLRGGKTDQEIAGLVGVERADTIRDWRTEEGWEADRTLIHGIVQEEVKERIKKQLAELNEEEDRLAKFVEAVAWRILNRRGPDGQPSATAAELHSIASALAATQKVRRMALGLRPYEKPPGPPQPNRVIEWVLRKPDPPGPPAQSGNIVPPAGPPQPRPRAG